MIKYFGKSFLSRYLILLSLLVLGWLPAIIDPAVFFILPNESLLIGENPGDSVNLYWLVVLPLVMAVSVFGLNLLAVKQGFTGMISTLTMFLYSLYLSAYPACFSANNIILISFLFILVLQSIMSFHERDDSIKNAFNSGIFVGLASVFYPPAVYLIIVIWFGILLHRVNSWRPFIAGFLGVFSNYLLLFGWYFVTDQWKQKGVLYLDSVIPTYDWKLEGNITEIAIPGLWLVFGLIVSLKVLGTLAEKNINLRRNLLLLVIAFFVITGISVVFNHYHFVLVAGVPVSLMAAHIFSIARRTLWIDRFLVVVTVIVVLFHLFRLYHAT